MCRRCSLLLIGLSTATGCAGDSLATHAGPAGALARWWSNDQPKPMKEYRAGGRQQGIGGDFARRWDNRN